MEMEKRSIHRYCFALPEGVAIPEKATEDKSLEVQLYQHLPYRLAVVETPVETSLDKVLEILSQAWELPAEMLSNQLAERIFRKNTSATAGAAGYRAFRWADAKRMVMTLEIRQDPALRDAYIQVHRPENIWKEITQNMDTMGIKDMELFLLGHRVFLLMDVPPGFDMDQEAERWGKLPREQEWQNHVAQFQKVTPEGKIEEKWEVMTLL